MAVRVWTRTKRAMKRRFAAQREGAGGRCAAAAGAGAGPGLEAVARLRRGGDGDARAGIVGAAAADGPPEQGLGAHVDGVGDAREVRRHGAGGGHGHGAGPRARAIARPALEDVTGVRCGRDRRAGALVIRAPAGERAAASWRGGRGEGVDGDEGGFDGAVAVHGHAAGAGTGAGLPPFGEAVTGVGDGDDGDDGPGVVRAGGLVAVGLAENSRAEGGGSEVVLRDEDGDDEAVARHADGAGAGAGAGPAGPVAEAVAAVRRGRDRDVGSAVVPTAASDGPSGGGLGARGERVDGTDLERRRHRAVAVHRDRAGARAEAGAGPLDEAVAEVGRGRHRHVRPVVVHAAAADGPAAGRRCARRERVARDEVRRHRAVGGHGHGAGSGARTGAGPAVEAVARARIGRDGDGAVRGVRPAAGDGSPMGGRGAGGERVARDEVRRDGAVGAHGDGAGPRSRAVARPAVEGVAAVGGGGESDARARVVRPGAGDSPPAGGRGARGERPGAREVGRDGAVGAHRDGAGARSRAVPRPAGEAIARVRRGRDRDVGPGIVRTPGADRPPAGWVDARGQRVAGDEVRRDGASGGHRDGTGARARAVPRPAVEAVARVRRGRDRDVRPGEVRAAARDRPPAGRVRARGQGEDGEEADPEDARPVQREGARRPGQGAVVAWGAGPAAPDVEAVAGLRRGRDGDARAGVVRARAGGGPPAQGLDVQVGRCTGARSAPSRSDWRTWSRSTSCPCSRPTSGRSDSPCSGWR